MLRLVARQLQFRPTRTILTITALAAVIAVILVLEGFNRGLLEQLRSAVLQRGSDLVVTQAGVSNMTAARSILPQFSREAVERVTGVATSHPLTGIPVIFERDGERTPIFLMVYDTSGGPARLVKGKAAFGNREIVIDRSLASKHGLDVGDDFVISEFAFRISGITSGAAAFFTPFAFARYDDLIDFYFESDVAADISTFPLLSFLLVDVVSGMEPAAVARAVEASVPSVDVFLPKVLARQDQELGSALFGPILRMLIGIGYVIGILVVGIILFASVNARRRELGVMKALGFSSRSVGAAVMLEALMLSVAALPLGILAASLIGRIIEWTAPLYLIQVTETVPLARTAIASIVFALLGALVPVALIRRIDPGLVFRS